MKKFAAAGVLVLAVTGCTVTAPDPDQVGIVYDAGSFSDTKFQNCVKPGERDFSGASDESYVYPSQQRTYDFTGGEGSESKPVESVTKDGVKLTISGGLTFYAAFDDCEMLRTFHEQIGIKYKAYDEDGWANMLRFYLGGPIKSAMDEQTLKYGWEELRYNRNNAKDKWEQAIAESVSRYVEQATGQPFFTRMQMILRSPKVPDNIADAVSKSVEAEERNKAQKNENERVKTELESIKDLVKVLGPEGYVLYQAIKDGKVSIVPVPAGGAINVTPQQ